MARLLCRLCGHQEQVVVYHETRTRVQVAKRCFRCAAVLEAPHRYYGQHPIPVE